jgi:hypothetical protein
MPMSIETIMYLCLGIAICAFFYMFVKQGEMMNRICLTIWVVLALIMAFDNDYRIEQLEKQIQVIRVEQVELYAGIPEASNQRAERSCW